MKFALAKIRGGATSLEALETFDQSAGSLNTRAFADLAAPAIRILLEFTVNPAAVSTQKELVASHMRIVWSIDHNRGCFTSGYPCEPIPAVAAVHHCYEVHRQGWNNKQLLQVVRNAAVDRIVVGKGSNGELFARLILTLAWDGAARHRTKSGTYGDIPSVPLEDFLRVLMPAAAFDEFWKARPDGCHKR